MFKRSILAAALAASFSTPVVAASASDKELTAIREQIRLMKDAYEARLQALEQRVKQAEATAATAVASAQAAPAAPAQALAQQAVAAPAAAAAPAASNLFNPNISLILGGTMARLSEDPQQYRLQGFRPSGGEVGPGKRGFSLGESELTLAANIDPRFSGQLTFALSGEDTVGVEEAFIQTRGLSNGLNLRAGRFLSSVGYLNGQHAHTWDFVDAPLSYQAFFGGQYKADGVQAKWLAPTDKFIELGMEVSSGASFPGKERNKNGAGAKSVFAHIGDDIGASSSYRAGLSYLRTGAEDASGADNPLAFHGKSSMWIADAIYKWAPNGNATKTNFKLQGEYFRRKENGSLDIADAGVGAYRSSQSGWYLQGVYQFMPSWRAGLRYDRLASGSRELGGDLTLASAPILEAYSPSRSSVMFDYSPSEFSRLRLQLARDKSRPGVVDNQIFLQYIMSLGTHAAHAF
ncbi:hypothetical protein [Janthinobacterium fluminis]|uniref:Porin n=1 Tax=Janthinobacterium fluminis TaxID=2987524 RepID=A0ABT5JVC7_9BURK|nr:hypothetical protein [Janthinobacterium fluminis]MDC8756695.1 hypothetical protein [Janthinobacterium fluminis]